MLCLPNCHGVTDAGMAFLATLVDLTTLQLR